MADSRINAGDTVTREAPADLQFQFDGDSVEARLDARLYSAEDAGGVLDGVAATGNVNQALLQERFTLGDTVVMDVDGEDLTMEKKATEPSEPAEPAEPALT